MTDRTLIAIGIIVGIVTLYAVVVAADGVVTEGELKIVATFIAGGGFVYLAMGGKKGPK